MAKTIKDLNIELSQLRTRSAYILKKYYELEAKVQMASERALEASKLAQEALIELKAMQKSTHNIQYVPMEQPKAPTTATNGSAVDWEAPYVDDRTKDIVSALFSGEDDFRE